MCSLHVVSVAGQPWGVELYIKAFIKAAFPEAVPGLPATGDKQLVQDVEAE